MKDMGNEGGAVVFVERLPFTCTPGQIRRHFKENDARPADIHLVLEPNGKHNGSAYLTFFNENDARKALNINGTLLNNKRVVATSSSEEEFYKAFPNTNMFTWSPPNKKEERGRKDERDRRGGHSTVPFGEGSLGGRRGRSRSPLRRDVRPPLRREEFLNNRNQPGDKYSGLNERKFLLVTGLPYNATPDELSYFFRPIVTRNVFFILNIDGKYVGKPNGNAIVEFFSEQEAVDCFKLNGRKMGGRPLNILKTRRGQIIEAIEQFENSRPPPRDLPPPQRNDALSLMPQMSAPVQQAPPQLDLNSVNQIANNNPQVQALVSLLTATISQLQQPVDQQVDPLISRVASSANVDVQEIKQGRAVGIRNLPYEVTPDQILRFFRDFSVIANSVRIHYLEDGRCSGDAIVSFQRSRDARNAVQALSKTMLGRRKVELFFL